MSTVNTKPGGIDESGIAAAAKAGDEAAFTGLTRRYRRELHVHCYRMLASFEDAEDMVQETFLRAWQKRETFQGRASFRAWLYRIATNACLDFLARHERRVLEISVRGSVPPGGAVAPHVAWLQPYPDRLLEQPAGAGEPEAALLRKETIELAFLVAMQLLPPRQRAVLILRDVLDWSASETAALLDSSVASVNAALQRARATMRERQPARDNPPAPRRESHDQERLLLQQYVDATERCDAQSLTRLLRDDVRFSMPPEPIAYVGRDAVVRSWVEGGFGSPPFDDFKCLVTAANGMPAIANYIRRPGEDHHRAFALDVLRIENGAIAEITAFDLANLVDAFAVPSTIS
ncbi:MAG: RNA polymerase subunit sigma-70 [Gemmatimonadota bacterium]|nr:RNA polymerase subunit sigma-70 [Gemmatimonadota bacterium]